MGLFRSLTKNGGWGYVIRNENGAVIQSGAGRVRFATNPVHMELLACIEGVKAAVALGISSIILETDAQHVVWAIQGDDYRLAVVGGLIHELKDMVSENFASCLVKHVPRDCNRVAHELASVGSRRSASAPLVLPGVPDCIMVVVSGDLADMVE